MAEKIFLLGRPGSGKSTVAQLLMEVAQKNGWDSRHIYDYRYLHGMFQQEINDNLPEEERLDRKSTRLNSSHYSRSRMPSSA